MSQPASALSPMSTFSCTPDLRMMSRTTSRTLPVRPVIGSVTCTRVDCQTKCFVHRNFLLQTTYASKHRDTSDADSVADASLFSSTYTFVTKSYQRIQKSICKHDIWKLSSLLAFVYFRFCVFTKLLRNL